MLSIYRAGEIDPFENLDIVHIRLLVVWGSGGAGRNCAGCKRSTPGTRFSLALSQSVWLHTFGGTRLFPAPKSACQLESSPPTRARAWTKSIREKSTPRTSFGSALRLVVAKLSYSIQGEALAPHSGAVAPPMATAPSTLAYVPQQWRLSHRDCV